MYLQMSEAILCLVLFLAAFLGLVLLVENMEKLPENGLRKRRRLVRALFPVALGLLTWTCRGFFLAGKQGGIEHTVQAFICTEQLGVLDQITGDEEFQEAVSRYRNGGDHRGLDDYFAQKLLKANRHLCPPLPAGYRPPRGFQVHSSSQGDWTVVFWDSEPMVSRRTLRQAEAKSM